MLIKRKSVERMALVRGVEFAAAVWQTGKCDARACDVDDQTWLALLAKYPKRFALGDAVAAVAQPIASAIDAVAGTNLKNCGGCAQRRAALNQAALLR